MDLSMLRARLGPLEAWQWGALGAGGILVYRYTRGHATTGVQTVTLSPAPIPALPAGPQIGNQWGALQSLLTSGGVGAGDFTFTLPDGSQLTFTSSGIRILPPQAPPAPPPAPPAPPPAPPPPAAPPVPDTLTVLPTGRTAGLPPTRPGARPSAIPPTRGGGYPAGAPLPYPGWWPPGGPTPPGRAPPSPAPTPIVSTGPPSGRGGPRIPDLRVGDILGR